MIPTRGYDGQTVAVLGLGRSGLAAAKSLIAGGAKVRVWDDVEASRVHAEAEGLEVADLTKDQAWEDVIMLVLSPGIAHLYPEPHQVVRQAWKHGAVVDNDIGLFFRSYATPDWDRFDAMPRIIAVTGSNGKSTTTALIGHLLESVGRSVQIGGNIGRSALDLDPASDGEVVVLELSSYQTELARALAPDIALFLNLTPDHHDRHGGHGGYFAAKQRLFAQGGPDRAIIGVDEVEGAFLANQMRQESTSGDPVIVISSGQKLQKAGWSVFARKGFLAEWRKGKQVANIDLRGFHSLAGAHNHQNICAAYAACRAVGIAPRVIEAGLASFKGLAHRSELLREVNGVRFVNDSKATNAAAAATSLATYQNVHWILGGQGKEGGIEELAPYFDRVKAAYLIGEAAETYGAQLGATPQHHAGTIEVAVQMAAKQAQKGDVVLLAPAAASFDQFTSFEARGEAFRALVNAL